MALLGPAPAAIVALSALAVHALATRTPFPLVYGNVVALTVYPVAGALALKALGDPGADPSASFSGAAIIVAVYLATSLLNSCSWSACSACATARACPPRRAGSTCPCCRGSSSAPCSPRARWRRTRRSG